MYQKFADLSRRITGALADAELAVATRERLNIERDTMLADSDIEIGTHDVPGGKVVVAALDGGGCTVNFYPTDANTQRFANRFAEYCVDVQAKDAWIKVLKAEKRTITGTFDVRIEVDGKITRYVKYNAEAAKKDAQIEVLEAERQKIESECIAYCKRFHSELVDGRYMVWNGMITVLNGEVTFTQGT